MSYVLEALGRGLLGRLLDAFDRQLPRTDSADAENLFRRRQFSPTSADLTLRLGMAYLRGMRLRQARETLESAIELRPATASPLLALACVFDEMGRLERSIELLHFAEERDRRDPAIAFGLGMCHERRDELDQAVAAYRRSVALCPQLRNGHERLAAIAIRRGNLAEALSRYLALVDMEPGDLDLRLTLATLHLHRGEPQRSIDQYQRALLVEPECCEEALHLPPDPQGKDLEVAVATLQRLVRRHPDVSEFHVHLGDLYARRGDDQEAIDEYSTALKLHPNFLEATVKLGTQHLRRSRLIDAARAFNRAVDLNDRLLAAYVGLGVAQNRAGQPMDALGTFDLAASLEPNSTLLFAETTRLHLRSEMRREQALSPGQDLDAACLLREAIRRHRQALVCHPDHADLNYRYGLLTRELGDLDEAIHSFRRAVEANPHFTKAMIKLGICLRQDGHTQDAIETFNEAIRVSQRGIDQHYQLGLLFAQRNQFEVLVEEFGPAQADPIAFRENLTLALQNIGMIDRVSTTWRSICDLSRERLMTDLKERALQGNPALE